MFLALPTIMSTASNPSTEKVKRLCNPRVRSLVLGKGEKETIDAPPAQTQDQKQAGDTAKEKEEVGGKLRMGYVGKS